MAKYCEICKKGVMSGNKVSHSNRHTRTYWAPNVQKVSAIIDGQKRRVTVCTRCLRSGKVQRTIYRPELLIHLEKIPAVFFLAGILIYIVLIDISVLQ